MTLVGLVGILIGAFAWRVAFIEPTKLRFSAFAAAYILHVACSFVYYQGVQSSPSDTVLYYYDPYYMYEEGLQVGTGFVVYVAQAIKNLFGGTYLDFFLLFQAVGFYGVAFIMRTAEEIYTELGVPQPIYTYLLLLLPGMHFWSSAIGKDSLFFFAICLGFWGSMRLRQRYKSVGFAMLLMMMIRPHIALLAAAAVGVTFFFDRGTRGWIRFVLVIAALGGVALAILSLRAAYGIDLTSADSISDNMAAREQVLDTEDAGGSRVDAPLPLRIFALLFRPLFLDTEGFMGYAASAENLVFALIVAVMVFRFSALYELFRRVAFVRFAAIFSALLILLLGWGYYNMGLGLRQKATMILPGILVLFLAVSAFVSARKAATHVAP